MHIREATTDDNAELQRLQARCPLGTTLIVSAVNTPDFFARAKTYESFKVFVACEGERIVGSGACAIRQGLVNGEISRVGYEFQYFISPDHRRRGIARQLHQHIEDYLTQHDVALSYCLIMEGNRPSMRLFEGQGFKLHRTLVMPGLAIYREMGLATEGEVRPITSEDLGAVAELLNGTWQDYNLYEPTSAEVLTKFIERTPAYGFDNLFVLEDQGEILTCLSFWDWSQITELTVKALNMKIRALGWLLNIARRFRTLPRIPKAGDRLKQAVLTPIGFQDPKHLVVLLRHVNNLALQREIEQVFCVCERDHPLLSSMKGLIRIDTAMHLFVKPLQQDISLDDSLVFIDGIDL
ncbi:MAG: GNAT family N-acetyltransferase [Candidatus Bipolaricaulia bacterium]